MDLFINFFCPKFVREKFFYFSHTLPLSSCLYLRRSAMLRTFFKTAYERKDNICTDGGIPVHQFGNGQLLSVLL